MKPFSNISDSTDRGTPLISMRGIKKSFGDFEVLKGFDLDLYPRENLVILGKSGSGKTVLIKCLVRLMEVDSGEISVLGRNVRSLNQRQLDELRQEVGFLFQGSALYDSMTVRENLQFPLRRHRKQKRKKADQEEALIRKTLAEVDLEAAIDKLPAELSGGMKRRAALARTLIMKPKIILYDEPTTGLDPITSNGIIQLMLKIQAQHNTAALIITHDMDFTRAISNRIIILDDGRNYTEGTYVELSQSEDPKVRAFFKEVLSR
jgi:phospholipid/cholesterol/gamma-HCH transport system ATP-binding protein